MCRPTYLVFGVAAIFVDVGLQVVGLVLVRHHEQDHKFLVGVLNTRGAREGEKISIKHHACISTAAHQRSVEDDHGTEGGRSGTTTLTKSNGPQNFFQGFVFGYFLICNATALQAKIVWCLTRKNTPWALKALSTCLASLPG